MPSQKDTETIIKGLIRRTFKLSNDNILAIAVIYSSVRKSPPTKDAIVERIENRYNTSIELSITQSTAIEIRKMNPERDIGIERNPGDFLAPMLAKHLNDIDLNGCEAMAYRDFEDNLSAWEGTLFIGIVAQA